MNKIAILKELQQLIQNRFTDSVEKIILFGSQINGKATAYSDYDILIVLKNDYDWRTENEILDLCYQIDLKYKIITDIKIISKNEPTTKIGKQPFIIDALEYGITV